MTRTEIGKMLKPYCKSWQEASSLQRIVFAEQMRSCQYDLDSLAGAWGWFLIGWRSAYVLSRK